MEWLLVGWTWLTGFIVSAYYYCWAFCCGCLANSFYFIYGRERKKKKSNQKVFFSHFLARLGTMGGEREKIFPIFSRRNLALLSLRTTHIETEKIIDEQQGKKKSWEKAFSPFYAHWKQGNNFTRQRRNENNFLGYLFEGRNTFSKMIECGGGQF